MCGDTVSGLGSIPSKHPWHFTKAEVRVWYLYKPVVWFIRVGWWMGNEKTQKMRFLTVLLHLPTPGTAGRLFSRASWCSLPSAVFTRNFFNYWGLTSWTWKTFSDLFIESGRSCIFCSWDEPWIFSSTVYVALLQLVFSSQLLIYLWVWLMCSHTHTFF